MRYFLPLFSALLLSACHNPSLNFPVTKAQTALIQSQAALPPGYRPPSSTPKPCPSTFQVQAALPPGYRPPSAQPPSSNCPCSGMQSEAILPPGVNPCK